MRNGDGAHVQEVVIVRRRSDGEDGHHGGAWKIAFADFMTAMMTFFLVMWLINSSDKKSLAQISSYFNPIKLTDKVTRTKGVRDLETGAEASEKVEGKVESPPGQNSRIDKSEKEAKSKEEMMFKDPFGVLKKIVKEAKTETAKTEPGQAKASQAMASQVLSLDPFMGETASATSQDPGANAAAAPVADNYGQRDRDPGSSMSSSAAGQDLREAEKIGSDAAAAKKSDTPADQRETVAGLERDKQNPAQDKQSQAQEKQNEAIDRMNQQLERATVQVERSDKQNEQQNAAAAQQIQAQVAQMLKDLPADLRPNIEITATKEGLLFSLTDNLKFAMFASGSAEPDPQLVAIMDRLGALVSKIKGKIVVRGHTDGRQYKAGGYGNWRLSSDRAQMAYFMLLRAKVDESRVARIEGYADRTLKFSSNPLAAENRRIEILILKDTKS